MYKISLLLFCVLCFTAQLSAQWANKTESLKQHVAPPQIPANIDFCGEKIPLENFDVRESLQRELNSICYWHSSLIYTLQLANRYMPVIEKLLKQNGVPDDIKYLCVTESNLQNVVSPAKAAGFWQFVPVTAKEYKLEITAEIDERYNLEKATKAACSYLKTAKQRFGNWTTAAASYNVGMAHMTNQIATQKEDSYYDLYLNPETARYVFRAIAFKIVMQNPTVYGFHIPQGQFSQLQYKEVNVTGPVNWVDFAQKNKTNYKVLREFNPWIRSTKLSTAKTYKVRLPKSRQF